MIPAELQARLRQLQTEQAALMFEIKQVERALEEATAQQLLKDIQQN